MNALFCWIGFATLILVFLLVAPVTQALIMSCPRYLELANGQRIAYYSTDGSISPGIVFLNGFRSEMAGRKAMAMERHCQQMNRPFVRFDYRGHGRSSGEFMELTLSDWIQDTLKVLDTLTSGPQILVGSSMGAWIALHVALQRSNRVTGIVGIAAAPDFTRDIYSELSGADKHDLKTTEVFYRPSQYSDEPYPITSKLMEDAQQWCLLNKTSIPIKCPIHLIHGQKDKDVSFQKSETLAKLLDGPSSNVQVTLRKDGDHRLSKSNDLEYITSVVEGISELYETDGK